MPTVSIVERIFEPHSGQLTGFRVTVQYGEPQTEVLILGILPLSEPEQAAGIREEIRRLGEALIQVAQSPQGIISRPKIQGEQ